MKKALITGITGQDGSYLAEFLLAKGYQVHGMIRRVALEDQAHHLVRISHLSRNKNFKLHAASLENYPSICQILTKVKPDEIYHLAAQSFVSYSFEDEHSTMHTNVTGTHFLLAAVSQIVPKAKFYFAASSEMFGNVLETPQTEKTLFNPRSPYGVSKVTGYHLVHYYRNHPDIKLFGVCGILFNHESPRRGMEFVTRKITHTAALIKHGLADKLLLGNPEAKRDWGYAGDYCLDLETQLLTETGFKYYNQVEDGDTVVNFNIQENRIEKDKILKTHLLDYGGKMFVFEGRGIKVQCSPDHRIIYQSKSKNSKGGWSKWKIDTAKEFANKLEGKALRSKYDYRLPGFWGYESGDLPIQDDWFSLVGYLAAEGHVKFSMGVGRGISIALSQSKSINPQYYHHIKNVCKKLHLRYRERIRQDGVSEFIFNAVATKQIFDLYDGHNIHRIPEWFLNASSRQLTLLLTAMMNGDGAWGSMTYLGKNLSLISDFQVIATKLGYRTTVHKRKSGMFECTMLAKRKSYAYITNIKTIPYNDKIWCITTKNGSMVIRKDNNVSVVGNCEAMWLMMQQPKPDDFVIATGETHSIREFAEETFKAVGLNPKKYIVWNNPADIRPSEVHLLIGDASKAKKLLGWKPKIKFKKLIKMMAEADLKKYGVKK